MLKKFLQASINMGVAVSMILCSFNSAYGSDYPPNRYMVYGSPKVTPIERYVVMQPTELALTRAELARANQVIAAQHAMMEAAAYEVVEPPQQEVYMERARPPVPRPPEIISDGEYCLTLLCALGCGVCYDAELTCCSNECEPKTLLCPLLMIGGLEAQILCSLPMCLCCSCTEQPKRRQLSAAMNCGERGRPTVASVLCNVCE
jgi:hypothetical protein